MGLKDMQIKPEVGWMIAFVTLFGVLIFVIIAFVLAFPKCPSMLFNIASTDTSVVPFLSVAPSNASPPGFGSSVILANMATTSNTSTMQLAQTWFFRLTGTGSGQYYLYNMLVGLALGFGSGGSTSVPAIMVNVKSSSKSPINVIPNSASTNGSEFSIVTQLSGTTFYLDPTSTTPSWLNTAPSAYWNLIPNQVSGNLTY